MKAAAGIATVLAHAVAFAGLGSIAVPVAPQAAPALDVTTIELVELPAPTPIEAPPAPSKGPAPELEPVDPEPPKAPREPRPLASPKARPVTPAAADPAPAAPLPAATNGPGPATPTKPAATATPRKLGERLSNVVPNRGRHKAAAGGCTEPVVKPVPTQKVKAKFPAAALRSDIEGSLVLRASVNRTGDVTAVKIVKSPGASVEPAAKSAFAQWRFSPATACGKAVSSTYAKAWKFSGG